MMNMHASKNVLTLLRNVHRCFGGNDILQCTAPRQRFMLYLAVHLDVNFDYKVYVVATVTVCQR